MEPTGADDARKSPSGTASDSEDLEPSSKKTSIDSDAISAKVRRLYELVPEPGADWRWYDIPYRFLWWSMRGWRRQLLPGRTRYRLNKALNFFGIFNHFERLKVEPLDDPMENLIVPPGEEITQGGIWIVELFPPSHFAALRRSLDRNGWDAENLFHREDKSNAQLVAQARHGRGFMWSRLGTVANPNTTYPVFDAKREVLPAEFNFVELSAVQMGHSLTAVIAFMRLSEVGQRSLNEVWKAQHEPRFEWRGLRMPRTEGRLFAAIRATQTERQRIHDVGRRWLEERCGGFLAASQSRQPVIDLSVFAEYDPLCDGETRRLADPLRALALEGTFLWQYVSPQMPGVALVPTRVGGARAEVLTNCWGAVCSHERFNEKNDRLGYGARPFGASTIAAIVDDAVRAFMLHLAVLQYVEELRSRLAEARDAANAKHGRFSQRGVRHLRSELLRTSLDLHVVGRDAMTLWDKRWRSFSGVEVRGVPLPGDAHPPEEFDFIEDLRRACKDNFKKLIAEDSAYREVLTTVTSLGASAESSRLGRLALVVAAGSLLVAVATMLVANTGDQTLWGDLVAWIKG